MPKEMIALIFDRFVINKATFDMNCDPQNVKFYITKDMFYTNVKILRNLALTDRTFCIIASELLKKSYKIHQIYKRIQGLKQLNSLNIKKTQDDEFKIKQLKQEYIIPPKIRLDFVAAFPSDTPKFSECILSSIKSLAISQPHLRLNTQCSMLTLSLKPDNK